MAAERPATLPEVTPLEEARPGRPENAVGIGEFWYEPEVWTLPLSPASRVLYASLCSFVPNGKINRRDLRNALSESTDAEVSGALEDLVRHGLLEHSARGGYTVRSVEDFRG
ncbi:MAG: hypothetical protein H0V53_07220 [Rubrobacter sp.]|jgi:hypothetical protein|nr:hypothetical protein [Rubrobacter sp.]